MGGRGHKRATDWQIADLRRRVSALEATDERVHCYRRFLSDRVLHRFITARDGNIDAALGMLVNHLIWRESYGIDTILDEDLSDFDLSKVFFWCGFDRGGRPCLVYRAGEEIKPDSKKEKPTAANKVRFFCQLLEQGFRDFAPAHKFCLIVDCRGAGSNVLDRKLLEVAMPILKDNFPETQHSTYVVPWNPVAMMAWKAVSSFIDPGMADKVRVVSDFEGPLMLEAFTPGTLKAILALDPSRATPQPHVDPDPLSLPPPTLGAHPENARHPTSPSMFSSLAARRLSAASLVARATKPPSAGKGRSPGDESLLATGKLSSGEDARDDEGKDAMACPSAVTAVYGSVVTTEERSPAPPSSSGSSKNHKPRGTHRDDASLWLSGYSRYSRLRYSEAPESWEDDLFSPSPEGSIVTPDAGSPQAGVTSFPRVGPSPSPSSALAPSPSPSSAYPPPSPGGASDEDFISVRFGDDGGVDSILDERYMDMVSTGRERFDPQEQKQKRSPGSSESGSASPATTQTLGATPEEQSAPLAGASPGATEQQQQQRREDPRHATDLADNKTGFVARQEVRRESEVVKGGGCVAHHACAEEIRQTSSSTEWKEKTGYLYKRRDILKGRFAHRERFAILRFPPTAAMTSMRCGDGAKRTPPAPTLTLLKNDQAGAGKVVSLEGAEVTLGTAMAGDLFPFVVSFPPLAPSPPPSPSPLLARRRRGGADKPREKRRNTDDFVFMGVVDLPLQSADEVPARRSSSESGGPRSDSADSAMREAPWGGCGLADEIGDELSSLRRGNGNVSLPAVRKTLHLACDTQEKTLGWARWIADAAALYEAALEAVSNEERGREGRMGAHVATSPWGSSPLLGVPAAVEDCWPRRTGTDGFALGASGAGAKGQRGGGEKVSSAGARRFLHVLDSFRRCTAAGCLAHGITPGGPSRSSPSSLYTRSPAVRAGIWRGLGLGDVRESLLAMRDTEISRLRRSYARSEVSRWEMTRCLRALAVQLRDDEARTGALLADREAARRELSAKEAELARQKAFTEDTRAKALVEARSKEALVSNLRVENQALQAALERVRLELQEERELLERDRQEAEAASASASVRIPVLAPLNGTKKVKGESGGWISRNTRRASHLGSYLHPPASQASSRKDLPRHSVGASPAPLSRAGTHTRLSSTSGRSLLEGNDRQPRSQSYTGLFKNFGGIGSRFKDMGRISKEFQGMEGKLNGKSCRPCILNMDQTWVGAICPPLQVLDRLLDGLEDVLALVGPWDEQGVLTSEAFVAWSSSTGELQRVPALESVDLPGEKRFTEGCLKLLRSHAAMVLGKKPDQLTGEDESRMAYVIGDGVYTISRLSAHLGALTAGLPTE